MKPSIYNLQLYILLVILTMPNFQFSQSFIWGQRGGSHTFFVNNGRKNEIKNLVTDSQNNYYALGIIGHLNTNIADVPKSFWGENSSNFSDVFLTSFACDGSYRWSKIIGGGGSEYFNTLSLDSNNNLYMAGNFSECGLNTNFPPRIDHDFIIPQSPTTDCRLFVICKYDSEGVLQWVKRPEDSVASSFYKSTAYGADIDQNGVLHVFAHLHPGSFENGQLVVTGTERQYYVMRYAANGTFLGASPFDFTEWNGLGDNFKFRINPHNNQYYIMGYRNGANSFFTTGGVTYTGANMPKSYFASYNQQGQLLWMRNEVALETPSDNSRVVLGDFIFDGPDIYIVTNMNGLSWVSFLGYTNDSSNGGATAVALKTNATADVLYWGSRAGQNTTLRNRLTKKNDKIYITTTGNQTFVWGNQSLYVNQPGQKSDVMLVELNKSDGACTSLAKIAANPNFSDLANVIITDNNNDLVLGGYFESEQYYTNNTLVNANGREDFFLAKYATDVCALSTEAQNKQKMVVYPNPSSGLFQLHLPVAVNAKLFIINALGQKVYENHLDNQQQTVLDLTFLDKGFYYIKVVTDSNESFEEKVIIAP